MKGNLVFVDTNVLVYAHDGAAGKKREIAAGALRDLWASRSGALSPQVLQEFYVNVTKKIPEPVAREHARLIVSTYSAWCIDVTSSDVIAAFRIEGDAGIGFWDALIVASAAKAGANVLLSEDLNHGQTIAGVRVRNPFTEDHA